MCVWVCVRCLKLTVLFNPPRVLWWSPIIFTFQKQGKWWVLEPAGAYSVGEWPSSLIWPLGCMPSFLIHACRMDDEPALGSLVSTLLLDAESPGLQAMSFPRLLAELGSFIFFSEITHLGVKRQQLCSIRVLCPEIRLHILPLPGTGSLTQFMDTGCFSLLRPHRPYIQPEQTHITDSLEGLSEPGIWLNQRHLLKSLGCHCTTVPGLQAHQNTVWAQRPEQVLAVHSPFRTFPNVAMRYEMLGHAKNRQQCSQTVGLDEEGVKA